MSAPAAPLMDYNTGRPELRAYLWLFGYALAGVLVAGIGFAIFALAKPSDSHTPWEWYHWLGMGVGGGMLTVGALAAVWPMWAAASDYTSYQRRQREAFDTDQELRRQQGGVITEEVTTEWEYRADKVDDMLIIVIATHRAVQRGVESPWSVRRLVDEGVWLGQRKLGDVNTNQARLIAQQLEVMGLVTGRGERQAGRWVPTTEGEALDLFERNSKKVL